MPTAWWWIHRRASHGTSTFGLVVCTPRTKSRMTLGYIWEDWMSGSLRVCILFKLGVPVSRKVPPLEGNLLGLERSESTRLVCSFLPAFVPSCRHRLRAKGPALHTSQAYQVFTHKMYPRMYTARPRLLPSPWCALVVASHDLAQHNNTVIP